MKVHHRTHCLTDPILCYAAWVCMYAQQLCDVLVEKLLVQSKAVFGQQSYCTVSELQDEFCCLKWSRIRVALNMRTYTEQKYKSNTNCFCPNLSWHELEILKHFLQTQNHNFSQIHHTLQVCHMKMLIGQTDYCYRVAFCCGQSEPHLAIDWPQWQATLKLFILFYNKT